MEKLVKMRRGNSLHLFKSTRQAIELMTEATNNHFLTPELCLRLVTPRCSLWQGDYKICPFPDPFWAFYWPGGEALTRYLLDNKHIIREKNVLDLGSGCGSIAIAAAKIGTAATVTANDIDPVAAVAIEVNATLNHCHPNTIRIDTHNLIEGVCSPAQYDCVLLGDMFYNEEFNNRLIKWLRSSFNSNVDILIGDPGRHMRFFREYKHIVEKVAEYETSEEYMKLNELTMRHICVWKLYCK